MFISKTYNDLKALADTIDKNIINSLTNKAQIILLTQLKEGDVKKEIDKFFDKSDLRSDKEKQEDMFIYNNDHYLKKHADIQMIKEKKSVEELEELL